MGSSSAPGPPQQPVGLLRDAVLVQAGSLAGAAAAEVADRDGSGLVLCGENAVTAARAIRDTGFGRPVLIDRRRYSGMSRALGTDRLSPYWMDEQRRLGAASVLTDSGYIGERNLTALTSVLSQAADAGDDVTAVLPLHKSWLRTHADLLTVEIRRYGVPVALVLEDPKDPLNSADALRGLVEVLRSGASVALLCTDMSGLGALCFGAQWAAIGVQSSLRHLYPADGGGGAPPNVSTAFVTPLMAFISTDLIADSWAASPDSPVWKCPCTVCEDGTVDRLKTASPAEVERHTFECLLELRDGLASLGDRERRESSWRAKCGHALSRYDELKIEYGVVLRPPRVLKGWCAA